MKGKILLKTIFASLALFFLSVQGVFAAGAELPANLSINNKLEVRATRNDVICVYDTYQGEEVTVTEIKKLPDGSEILPTSLSISR